LSCEFLYEEKFPYVSLNIHAICPRRNAVPVNVGGTWEIFTLFRSGPNIGHDQISAPTTVAAAGIQGDFGVG
jgi:hypothetical protein